MCYNVSHNNYMTALMSIVRAFNNREDGMYEVEYISLKMRESRKIFASTELVIVQTNRK